MTTLTITLKDYAALLLRIQKTLNKTSCCGMYILMVKLRIGARIVDTEDWFQKMMLLSGNITPHYLTKFLKMKLKYNTSKRASI